MDIKRLKQIATDIINDDEWVNDSHSKAEHDGIRNGLERLLNHLVEIKFYRKTEVSDKFKKQDLINAYYDWYRHECSDPYDELEWLINCALGNDKERKNVIDVLETTYKHYNNE